MMSHWIARLCLAAVLTAAFVYWALTVADTPEVLSQLTSLRPDWLLPLAAFALMCIALRWLRLLLLLGRSHALPLLRASTLHGMAVALLPAKLGELVLPAALMHTLKIGPSRATGMLLLLRLYDLLVIAIVGLGAFGLLSTSYDMASLGVPALIVALALAASLFALPAFIRRFRKAALTLLGDRRRPAAVLDGLTAAAAELSVAKGARLFAATALIWGSFFGLCHTASLAVGGAWGPDFSVLAGSAGSLAFALPINGLANLGPFEAAFSGSLVAAGAALELALGAALLVHLVAIAAAVFAAAAAQILVIRTHRAPRNVD